jgi:PAS domain S-box-containing protein
MLRALFPHTLRHQLTLGVALVIAVLMTGFIWNITERQQTLLLDRQSEQAAALAHSLATTSATGVATRDLAGLRELIHAQRRYPDLAYAMILDQDGQVLAHSDPIHLGQRVRNLPTRAESKLLAHTPTLVDAISPIFLAKRRIGWVRIGLTQHTTQTKLAEITRDGLLYTLAAIIIGTLLAWFMARRLTRRLSIIQRVADAVEHGDLARRTTLSGTDEAAYLAHAFDHMLDGLAASREALTKSEARANLIIDSSPDAMLVVDVNGCILRANRRIEQLFGYDSTELIGQPIESLLPEHMSAHHVHVRECYASDSVPHMLGKNMEIAARRKDGSEFPVEISLAPMHTGEEMQTIATLVDVTQKRALEAELISHRDHLEELVINRTIELEVARNEAEHLAKVKSEFLANMSHEIRTPLNAVLGMARIGARDSVGRASHATFTRIQDAGAHLLGLINDVLDFSKLDAGKLCIERHPFALAAVIDNAVSFITGAAQFKGLRFEMTSAPDLPTWVNGDALRLQQVLGNLLSNAVKFTKHGEVRLRVARDGEDIYFKTIDSGIGLTPEQITRLFQPFEQADSSTTREYGGSGLGLSISQNLARMMGGEITVDSSLVAGSSFTLRLPLPAAAPALPKHTNQTNEEGQRLIGLQLLAAEDVEINRLILEDLLVHEGARVVFAADGQQAIERLQQAGANAFDAVLMDVQMPVMDGFEATRRILKIAPALPIIGLTAHAMAEERERCLATGMVEHVTKPIEAEVLVAAILRHAGRRMVRTALPPASLSNGAVGEDSASAGDNTIDWLQLLTHYNGRQAFVSKLATTALNSHRDTPTHLRATAELHDLESLAFTAHALKGLGGNLMARSVQTLAKETEIAARAGQSIAPALANELADALDTLLTALTVRINGDHAITKVFN